MSTIYNLEPPTKGKVVIRTTLGDIDVELWPKEAPKAVRNFVQLCMEGYYDGTIFHRVIKNFMIQGGDPSGTGSGGESIYGGPFKDEFHSRIKFNHRGLVACANENQPHSNGSQFFITLEACPHLDRKHTIFGKIVGDSIYNVAHFNELESVHKPDPFKFHHSLEFSQTDGDDRPAEAPKFLNADILWNPFEDITLRSTKEEREAEAALKREQEAEEKRRDKKRQKKNLGLLSFGEEAGEEEAGNAADTETRIGSVFEAANDEDPRLVKSGTEVANRLAAQEAAEEAERKRLKASVKAALARPGAEEGEGDDKVRAASEDGATSSGPANEDKDDFAAKMRAKALAKRDAHVPQKAEEERGERSDGSGSEGTNMRRNRKHKMRERQQEALASGKIKPARIRASKLFAQQDTTLMSDGEKRRLEAKQRSRLARDNSNSLTKLLEFKKRLASNQALGNQSEEPSQWPAAVSRHDKGYNGKPKEGPDSSLPAAWRIDSFLDDYEDEKLDTLAQHKLKFEKEGARRDAMATNFDDTYEVQDPLLERNEKWNSKDGAAKRSQRAWAAGHEGPLD